MMTTAEKPLELNRMEVESFLRKYGVMRHIQQEAFDAEIKAAGKPARVRGLAHRMTRFLFSQGIVADPESVKLDFPGSALS